MPWGKSEGTSLRRQPRLWDSYPPIPQKALTTARHAHRTKDWAELAGCRPAHPPLETGRWGQPEPEVGNLGPRKASHTKLQADFSANQDFLGFWTIDIHREGHSQRLAPQNRHTAHLRRRAHCTPRKPSAWNRGGDKPQPSTGGHYARQSTWSPQLLGPGTGAKRRPNQVCTFVENPNLSS